MQENSLDLSQLRQVARKMRQAGLSGIEISNGHYKVRLKYAPALSVAASPAPAADSAMSEEPPLQAARAQMPGRVLLWHPADGKPFAAVGATVEKDALLALVKVGLIYLPVRSPAAGVVASLAVAHGDCVEYDSEIMAVRATL